MTEVWQAPVRLSLFRGGDGLKILYVTRVLARPNDSAQMTLPKYFSSAFVVKSALFFLGKFLSLSVYHSQR